MEKENEEVRAVERLIQQALQVHLSLEKLGAYFDGEGSDVERAMVEAHLRKCKTCSAEYNEMVDVLTTYHKVEVPEEDIHRLKYLAAIALGRIGDARAVERLLELTEDKDRYVRRATIIALERLGDARAVERLLELTKDEDWSVRRAAQEALKRINNAQRAAVQAPLLQQLPLNRGRQVLLGRPGIGKTFYSRVMFRLELAGMRAEGKSSVLYEEKTGPLSWRCVKDESGNIILRCASNAPELLHHKLLFQVQSGDGTVLVTKELTLERVGEKQVGGETIIITRKELNNLPEDVQIILAEAHPENTG